MKITLAALINTSYTTYLNVYHNWRNYDKQTSTDCLQDENKYTFASDMVIYMGNPKELEKYIERMLNEFCKNNKQAFFEMILSTMTMANLFYKWGANKESKICSDYYNKLFFEENTYSKYIDKDELSDLWCLR